MGLALPFGSAHAAEPTPTGSACSKAGITKTRREAEKLYRDGRYAEAVERLGGAKATCWSALEATDRGWLVSDLGLAALRAGQPELCRQVLDEAPAELEPGSRVAKAVAHNRGLCQAQPAVGVLAVKVFPGLSISSPSEAPEALKREWRFSVELREDRLPERSDRELDRCTEAEGVALEDLEVRTTVDLGAVQARLLRCRAIAKVTTARPARLSHVRDLLSVRALGAVLPADLAPAFSPDETELVARASREGLTWSKVDTKVRFATNPERTEELRVVGDGVTGSLERWALGDFNGDGFEDVIVVRSMGPDGGSAFDMAAFLLTRTQPGGRVTVLERME